MLFVISEMVFVTTIFGMARRHYDENYQPMNKVKYHIYGARREVVVNYLLWSSQSGSIIVSCCARGSACAAGPSDRCLNETENILINPYNAQQTNISILYLSLRDDKQLLDEVF